MGLSQDKLQTKENIATKFSLSFQKLKRLYKMNFLFESVTKPDACYLQRITNFSIMISHFGNIQNVEMSISKIITRRAFAISCKCSNKVALFLWWVADRHLKKWPSFQKNLLVIYGNAHLLVTCHPVGGTFLTIKRGN